MHEQEKPKELGLSGGITLVISSLSFLADPVRAYLRVFGTWGDRFVSIYSVLGVCSMFLFIAEYRDPIAFPAFYLTCFMFLVHRIAGLWRPSGTHSQYDGRSWFSGDERRAKGFKEPLLVAIAGVACLSFSKGLGHYLLLADVGLVLSHAYYRMRIRAQVRQMRDSRIEAEIVRDTYQRSTR
jgi:hypothetical protein